MKFNILNDIIIYFFQRIDPFLSVKNTTNIIFHEIIDLKEFFDVIIQNENLK